MKKHVGMWLVLLTCACGSSDNKTTDNNGNGTGDGNSTVATANTTVTINGVLKPFPGLTALNQNDFAYASIALVNPEAILQNPNATPTVLGTTTVNPNTCTAQGCPFTISSVNVGDLSIGMAAGVVDTRLAMAPLTATLFPIFTGVQQTAITAALTTGNLNNVVTFAMSNEGFALLANTTTNPNQLKPHGVLIGLALDANLKPTAHATLTTTGDTGLKWYPGLDQNNMVTAVGTTTTGPTSASGIIIVSESTATVALGLNWTLAVAGSSLTYTVPSPLGTAPNFALIVPFPPNP